MIERIEETQQTGELTPEQASLLRRIHPDLLDEIQRKAREVKEWDEDINPLEKSVRPVDIPPSRERVALGEMLDERQMQVPLWALVEDGILDSTPPDPSMSALNVALDAFAGKKA